MHRKPSIFIGSSGEALKAARLVADELRKEFEAQVWDERLFELGEDTLTGLLRAVQSFDFAVLIISDDDTLNSRKRPSTALPSWFERLSRRIFGQSATFASPRDNVLFELGMFIGAMGRRKSFAVVVPSERGVPKIPSDLFGNTLLYLAGETAHSLSPELAARDLSPLVATIRERFANESEFELLPSTGSAVNYFHNFVLAVCEQLRKESAVSVNGQPVDIHGGKFRFRIVIPQSLQEANRPFAEQLFGRLPVTSFTIQATHRPFPFWVGTTLENNTLIFWDYPTVLRASDEAVLYVTRGAFLSQPSIRRRFEEKELHNFERTLRLLLATVPDAAVFKSTIEIISASDL